ncbi:hypothetical protein IWX49DRAFT_372069 [Phyllosticta citricarpa]|uniref:Secreted protein n=2 Tax=Phyllosticta TaxID=121621 RepID=A0ABR1MIT2_9PEZI
MPAVKNSCSFSLLFSLLSFPELRPSVPWSATVVSRADPASNPELRSTPADRLLGAMKLQDGGVHGVSCHPSLLRMLDIDHQLHFPTQHCRCHMQDAFFIRPQDLPTADAPKQNAEEKGHPQSIGSCRSHSLGIWWVHPQTAQTVCPRPPSPHRPTKHQRQSKADAIVREIAVVAVVWGDKPQSVPQRQRVGPNPPQGEKEGACRKTQPRAQITEFSRQLPSFYASSFSTMRRVARTSSSIIE